MQRIAILGATSLLGDPDRTGTSTDETLTHDRRASTQPAKRRWFSLRRQILANHAATRRRRQLQALRLSVGDDAAPRVQELLTPVPLAADAIVMQHPGVPRQAFFVLEGRVAITVKDQPVAVLGPGSFFGESEATLVRRIDVPRIRAIGPVVLGIADHIDLPELHQLVPDLPTLSLAAPAPAPHPDESIATHDHDEVMGLGFLQRIAG
ncbi:hypothetical protein [Ilumatobacter sp.]|uniref:hypothetical protein n=1 Tax=Ilumatobacter sp. TaxID=1967498 RepID=UPI003C51412D